MEVSKGDCSEYHGISVVSAASHSSAGQGQIVTRRRQKLLAQGVHHEALGGFGRNSSETTCAPPSTNCMGNVMNNNRLSTLP